jgi:hypothetical protein
MTPNISKQKLLSLIGCGTSNAVAAAVAAQGTKTTTTNPQQLQPKQQ